MFNIMSDCTHLIPNLYLADPLIPSSIMTSSYSPVSSSRNTSTESVKSSRATNSLSLDTPEEEVKGVTEREELEYEVTIIKTN